MTVSQVNAAQACTFVLPKSVADSVGVKCVVVPTEAHDREMIKQAPMYFSSKDFAQQGYYEILSSGRKPEWHYDPQIILSNN
jgi:hypothetical protein